MDVRCAQRITTTIIINCLYHIVVSLNAKSIFWALFSCVCVYMNLFTTVYCFNSFERLKRLSRCDVAVFAVLQMICNLQSGSRRRTREFQCIYMCADWRTMPCDMDLFCIFLHVAMCIKCIWFMDRMDLTL